MSHDRDKLLWAGQSLVPDDTDLRTRELSAQFVTRHGAQ